MKQGKGNYFFAPRIGEKYHEGFNGIRTLDTVKEMDYKCPKYKDAPFYEKAEDQLCLHNSNIIEVSSYCEDEARYPAYSVFTHDMTKHIGEVIDKNLQKSAKISRIKKREFS